MDPAGRLSLFSSFRPSAYTAQADADLLELPQVTPMEPPRYSDWRFRAWLLPSLGLFRSTRRSLFRSVQLAFRLIALAQRHYGLLHNSQDFLGPRACTYSLPRRPKRLEDQDRRLNRVLQRE